MSVTPQTGSEIPWWAYTGTLVGLGVVLLGIGWTDAEFFHTWSQSANWSLMGLGVITISGAVGHAIGWFQTAPGGATRRR